MELISNNDLENICGGVKITKIVETISLTCIIGGMIVTGALAAYDSVKREELERRKYPYFETFYVIKETQY
mgnify:CR=1 FL=1